MKKLEILLVAIVVMLLSFPLMYLIILLGTGNAELVFKGDLEREIEHQKKVKLEQQSDERDSLMLASSHAFTANVEEKKRLEAEREKLIQEQERLEMLRQELSAEREEIEAERKRYEKALADSEVLNQKRLKKLARVYGAMKANEGARIMETLDDQLCIDIFKYMSEDRQKAKILSAMSGEKAARLSKQMGIKIK